MNKVIQNCSVFPFLEKYEADMIYRIQINGCSLQVKKILGKVISRIVKNLTMSDRFIYSYK